VTNSSLGTSSTFDLLVQNGNLTSVVDGTGDLRADNVTVAVTGSSSTIGTGTANPLEIDASVLTTATSAGGNIFLKDVGGDFPLGLLTPGAATSIWPRPSCHHARHRLDEQTSRPPAPRSARKTASARLPPAPKHHRTTGAANSASGDIRINRNVGGLLTIGSVNGLPGISDTASGGQVVVVNSSPLTVASNVTAAGGVTLSAGETAADDRQSGRNSGVTIQSTPAPSCSRPVTTSACPPAAR